MPNSDPQLNQPVDGTKTTGDHFRETKIAHGAQFGAQPGREGTLFRYPCISSTALTVIPDDTRIPPLSLQRGEDNVFTGEAKLFAGDRYRLSTHPDGLDPFPDPFSRYQPEGISGASQVIDAETYEWHDVSWAGLPTDRSLSFYECHIGTLGDNAEGVQAHLKRLKSLGVDALQVMPVHQFVGEQNWGYDNALLFAFHNTYGHPDDFRTLVDLAHQEGLGVILDVVYNHLGDEGNYLWHLFQERLFDSHSPTPWGSGLDYRNPLLREVILQNASYWMKDFHLDGLRLDAAHHIADDPAKHILNDLTSRARDIRPDAYIVAEYPDELPDDQGTLASTFDPKKFGWSAQYRDSLSLKLRCALGEEGKGYLAPYTEAEAFHLASAINEATPDSHLTLTLSNHDWVGNEANNRYAHDRLGHEAVKTAALIQLIAPGSQMFFQGSEAALPNTFCYFRECLSKDIEDAVRAGRLEEHAALIDSDDPNTSFADPFDKETYRASRPDFSLVHDEPYSSYLAFMQRILRLHQNEPLLHSHKRSVEAVAIDKSTLLIQASLPESKDTLLLVAHLSETDEISVSLESFGKGNFALEDSVSTSQAVTIAPSGKTVSFAGRGAVLLRWNHQESQE